MIVVFPFSTADQDLALKNAQWMNELGGCRGHEVLVCYDARCNPETVEAIGQEMLKCFDKVYRLVAKAPIDGWPEGANYLFRLTTTWLQNKVKWSYFFWMEPDAIPLRKGWLEMIVEAHKLSGKPFMGDRVEVEDIPLHMSGIGVYPNPIHAIAGEAYRASEVAWDMAAKDQIIPNAHFTKLIEHAWKHPSFTNVSELTTQIRPEAVLFHASKDGSLIDILRKQKNPAVPVLAEADGFDPAGKARESTLGNEAALPVSSDSRGSRGITYDIFIRTYPGDYQWLAYCLQGIKKYVTGFRKIWIVSPGENPFSAFLEPNFVEWKKINEECEDGYLSQQITKLYADVLTDYQADYILHVDSDILFTRPTAPGDFFKDGKLIWYYTPYDQIETPWKPIIEKFMDIEVPFEFMRRLPMMVPRWLYPKLREFCHKRHGQIISGYVRNQPLRAFSEFNALGAFAFEYHHSQFKWIPTIGASMPEPVARQFHSWGGITPEVEKEINLILHGAEAGINPEPAADQPTTSRSAVLPGSAPLQIPQIKVLPGDIWVLEGDQISQWVEQEGRLDHDQNFLPDVLKHIKPGDTVLDVGAFIGDHTIAYSRAVGSEGRVLAFEPNPVAFQCLMQNTMREGNIAYFPAGISDRHEYVNLSGNNGNAGGTYVGSHMKVADVWMHPLDSYDFQKVDFIKLDVEGCEVKALKGMQKTIERFHPIMVIEVNEGALRRQGHTVGQLYAMLENYGYDTRIVQKNCCMDSPLYDVVATHKESPEVSKRNGGLTRCSSVPPPVTSLKEQIREHVEWLKNICEKVPQGKASVMWHLVKAGLKKPNPKNRKKTNAKNNSENQASRKISKETAGCKSV